MTIGPLAPVRPSFTTYDRPAEKRPETVLSPAARCIHRGPVPADNVGNLVAVHTNDVPEDEHGALMRCQLGHCGREIRVGVEARGEARFDTHLWDLSSQILGPARPPPQFVKTGESNAPEEPRSQRTAVAPDRRSCLDEFQKRLLDGILGEPDIVHHPVGE